jgi:CHAD domain-containing protein
MSHLLPTQKLSPIDDDTESLRSMAALIVSQSVKLVRKNLRNAAKLWKEDDEHVHQLRVNTRRALAAVDLFEPLLPKKESCWLNKHLKTILRAAGKARDLDVLLKKGVTESSDAESRLQKLWKEQRKQFQAPICKLDGSLRSELKDHKVSIRQLANGDPAETAITSPSSHIRHWIKHRFSEIGQRFLAKLAAAADVTSLHQLRIETKRLRYTLEIIRPALEKSPAEYLKTSLSTLQDVLGKLNDQVVALKHLKQSVKKIDAVKAQHDIARLIERHTAEIEDQCVLVWLWRDSPESAKLRRVLDSFASD